MVSRKVLLRVGCLATVFIATLGICIWKFVICMPEVESSCFDKFTLYGSEDLKGPPRLNSNELPDEVRKQVVNLLYDGVEHAHADIVSYAKYRCITVRCERLEARIYTWGIVYNLDRGSLGQWSYSCAFETRFGDVVDLLKRSPQ